MGRTHYSGWIHGFMINHWQSCIQIFKLCEQQMVTVDQVKAAPDLISFTRWLVDERRSSWEKILSEVNKIQLGNDDDLIR
jgi:hypothetical protein